MASLKYVFDLPYCRASIQLRPSRPASPCRIVSARGAVGFLGCSVPVMHRALVFLHVERLANASTHHNSSRTATALGKRCQTPHLIHPTNHIITHTA